MQRYGSRLFLILLLGSLALLLGLLHAFLSAIVLGLLIASVFYPLYLRMKRLLDHRDSLASVCMVLFIFLVLGVPAGWFVGTLSNEAFDFYEHTRSSVSIAHIEKFLESDSIWIERLRRITSLTGIELTRDTVEKLTAAIGKQVGLFLYKQISSVASNLFSFLMHFFLMLLVLFYLFRDGVRLRRYIAQLLPLPESQQEKVERKFHEMGRAIVVGNGLSGIVQGILGGVGFAVFGLASPFLWGTVLAFMAFLPIIGASVVFVPAAAILLVQGKIGVGIGYLIYNVCYSSIVEYIIKPRLIGKGMQMNALLVFIGIIGGIKLFGILGIVYGPLIITVFLTMAEIYRLEYRDHDV